MSRTVRINATLDEDLLARIDAYAEKHREDRSTAIRQLVDLALRDLAKREALTAFTQGRLTLREFARVLRLDIWSAHDLLAAEGVAVGQGDRAETAEALDEALRQAGGGRGRANGASPAP
ncbi:MAG: ribbon-helix-helix protein, CopG family [Actinomycetota bacterium]|nr:ribbon-helix-helix protein, CopG family [Actinomycetota bacterium]